MSIVHLPASIRSRPIKFLRLRCLVLDDSNTNIGTAAARIDGRHGRWRLQYTNVGVSVLELMPAAQLFIIRYIKFVPWVQPGNDASKSLHARNEPPARQIRRSATDPSCQAAYAQVPRHFDHIPDTKMPHLFAC